MNNAIYELRECLTWFANQHFAKQLECETLQFSIRKDKDSINDYDVRIRSDNPSILRAMDEATKFYAGEIDPKITPNFC